MLARKTEENVRVENNSVPQQYMQEKLVPDSSDHGLAPVSKPVSSNATAGVAAKLPTSVLNGSGVDWSKQDKTKGTGSSSADIQAKDTSLTKKVKRKPETIPGEAQFRLDKLPSIQCEEKYKPQKQPVVSSLPKANIQPAAPSSFQQHSWCDSGYISHNSIFSTFPFGPSHIKS